MAFAMRAVRKYWGWLLAFVVWLVVEIGSAVVQHGVDKELTAHGNDSQMWARALGVSGWVFAHWFSLTGWVLAVNLVVMFALAYRDERKFRAARILEHYAMKLIWSRAIVLRAESDSEDIDSVARWMNGDRGDLLNFTPSVFTQATVEAFRRPSLMNLGPAQALVKSLSDEQKRASILADVDHLLNAVRSKWQACEGNYVPTP